MSLHQSTIDDASSLECHRCDALVIETLMVYLKEFFETVYFEEKRSEDDIKACKTANSFDTDQARHNVRPDLNRNFSTLCVSEINF